MRARHWMRGLAVLVPMVAGIAVYVARSSVAADTRLEVTVVSSAPAETRNGPTYKGKTFDQWRALLNSELDSSQRRDPLWAMAVLGANERTEEAAHAIMDVIDSLSGLSSFKVSLDNAELQAFPELKADFELLTVAPLAFQRLGPKAAPVALQVWRDANRSMFVRQVAIASLAEVPMSKPLADTFVEALCDPDKRQRDVVEELLRTRLGEEQLVLAMVERLDGPVLSEALLQLVATLPAPASRDVVQRLVERSHSQDPAVRKAASLGVGSAGLLDPDTARRFGVDRDDLYTAARIVAEERLAHPGSKELRLDKALALLKDGSPLSRDAVPVLERIVNSSDKRLEEFGQAAKEALSRLSPE